MFPTSSPDIRAALSVEDVASKINWQANCGYPLFKKKNVIRPMITSFIRSWLHRNGTLSSGRLPQAICTIFNRIHAKNGKFKFRFIFAPNWQITVLEVILGSGIYD